MGDDGRRRWRRSAACSSGVCIVMCAWLHAIAIVTGAGASRPQQGARETPVDPATPPRLAPHKDVQPLLAGFVDPTLPPYQAVGDGLTDDAAALQSAIDDAYSARMTVVLPAGRVFLLSTQLRFVQPPNITGRSFGYAMIGARSASAAMARPVLKLTDHADTAGWANMPHNGTEPEGGQGNCAPSQQDCVPKVFLLYQYLETRSTSRDTIRAETFYLARLRGVDVDLGNNPGVSGVSMSSAQLASIEDVRVSGAKFHAGFNGLPGSGGFSANLEVEGGDYGVVQNQFRPNPSITGLRLVEQEVAGVVVDVSRGPVVISGFTVQGPLHLSPQLTRAYRAMLLRNPVATKNNALNAEDGVISLHASSEGGTAIETQGGDVVLKNVFVSGAKTIAMCAKTKLSLLAGSAGGAAGTVRVASYVLTGSGGQVLDRGKMPSYSNDGAAEWLPEPLEHETIAPWPPGSLPLLHSWNYSTLPSWDDSATLNVVTQYGATPQWMDDSDDDGEKIQKAIDDSCDPTSHWFGRAVFIPHGEYGIARPLDLRGGCAALIGAGTHSTSLATLPRPTGACWPSGASGAMLTSLRAVRNSSSGGSTFGIDSQIVRTAAEQLTLVSDFNMAVARYCPFMDLREGKLLLRNVGTSGGMTPPFHANRDLVPSKPVDATASAAGNHGQPSGVVCQDDPYVALRDGVSGRFYGLALDGCDLRHCRSSPHHLLLFIDGCRQSSGTIHLYQASTEHLINDYITLINASRCGVHFHAWKYENALQSTSSVPPDGSGSLVRIQGSSTGVSVFGASGNYHLFNKSVPIVDIVGPGSSNVSIMGMVRMHSAHEPAVGLEWLVDTGSVPTARMGGYNALLMYRDAPDSAV